ncbi:MAG: peptidase dimerization domain-containing protein, partial [Bacilli bacterium]
INQGLVDDVAHFFALHVDPSYETKTIILKRNALYGSCDDFDVTIKGQGGHIATPHLCYDPLPFALNFYHDLNNIILNQIDRLRPAILGLSSFNYGQDTYNIINDEVSLKGSLRCLDEQTRTEVLTALNDYVINLKQNNNLDISFNVIKGDGVLINDVTLINELQPYLLAHLNETNQLIEIDKASYGSEDFTNYAQLKPSIYFLVGAKVNDYDFHNSRFQVDYHALQTSIDLFINIINYFNQKESKR